MILSRQRKEEALALLGVHELPGVDKLAKTGLPGVAKL